jgi:hypothetical protein
MILGLYWVRWWIISPVHSVFNVPMDIRQF